MEELLRQVLEETRASRDDVRLEIAGLRDDVRLEIAGLRDEVRLEIAGLRDELHAHRDETRELMQSMWKDLSSGLARVRRSVILLAEAGRASDSIEAALEDRIGLLEDRLPESRLASIEKRLARLETDD